MLMSAPSRTHLFVHVCTAGRRSVDHVLVTHTGIDRGRWSGVI